MLKGKAIKIEDPLPQDLITEILSWLPVKALLQFKCVCKSWYAIITSQAFISRHLNNYYDNYDDSDTFLAQYFVTKLGELALYEFLVDETSTILSYEELRDRPIYNSFICGPCNGIFYLDRYSYRDHRALWNPATNELKTLPPLIRKPNLPSLSFYAGVKEVFGFGFDRVTKDYKVIVIKSWSKTNSKIRYPLSVFVYSLSTDSWRYWGDLPQNYKLLSNNKCYICLNGVFYWLGSDYSGGKTYDEAIISFDMATDLIQDMQLPNYDKPARETVLSVYHDSLALLTVHDIKHFLEIWTLKEGCWTKQFTVGTSSYGRISPIAHWKNSKFIFECGPCKELTLFDIITQEITYLGYIKDIHSCEGIFVYRGSLVSFKDRNEHWEAEALAQ
jgi:F-box interacting protein